MAILLNTKPTMAPLLMKTTVTETTDVLMGEVMVNRWNNLRFSRVKFPTIAFEGWDRLKKQSSCCRANPFQTDSR